MTTQVFTVLAPRVTVVKNVELTELVPVVVSTATVAYTPGTPENWSPEPDSAEEALDEIAPGAARTEDLDMGTQSVVTKTVNQRLFFGPNNHGAFVVEPIEVESFYFVPGGERGIYCIDMQMFRSADTQIASGEGAVLIGGNYNTNASLGGFIGGGNGNTIVDYDSSYSAVFGSAATVDNQSDNSLVHGNLNQLLRGRSSLVSGENNTASFTSQCLVFGQRSAAVNASRAMAGGFSCYATNTGAMSLGEFNLASGTDSAALGGSHNNATNTGAAAVGGTQNLVTGSNSAAAGNSNWVTNNNSTAFGAGNVVSINNATAMGRGARASGIYDFVLGNDGETGSNQAGFGTVDATHFRVDGTTQSVHVGRPTDQPSASVVQAATITVGEPAVIDIGGGTLPANGSTVLIAATSGALPAATAQTVTCALGTANTWTAATTAIANGAAVTLASTNKLPSSFVFGTVYYVVNTGTGGNPLNFQLALVPGGTAIGSSTNGFQDGVHTATVAGLAANRRYFVVGATGTGFNLANSLGGPAIPLYGVASGTYTATTLTRANASAINRMHFHTTNPGYQSKAVTLRAPTNLTADVNYDLPAVDGSVGQVLKTDGSGVMSWGAAVGSGAKSSAADAGFLGQLSQDGSFLYVCVVAGAGGAATWMKTALSAAA